MSKTRETRGVSDLFVTKKRLVELYGGRSRDFSHSTLVLYKGAKTVPRSISNPDGSCVRTTEIEGRTRQEGSRETDGRGQPDRFLPKQPRATRGGHSEKLDVNK